MSTGTTCTLYLAGTRFADGSPGDPETDPVALSPGLGIAWGQRHHRRPTSPRRRARSPSPACPGSRCSTGSTPAPRSTSPRPASTTPTRPCRRSSTPASNRTRSPRPPRTPPWTHPPVSSTVVPEPSMSSLSTRPAAGRSHSRRRRSSPPGPTPARGTASPQTAPGQTWDVGAWIYAPPGVELDRPPGAVQLRPLGGRCPTNRPRRDPQRCRRMVVRLRPIPGRHRRRLGRGRDLRLPDRPGVEPGRGRDDLGAGRPGHHLGGRRRRLRRRRDRPRPRRGGTDPGSPRVLRAGHEPDGHELGRHPRLTGPILDVTAADFTADLANRDIGDEPWLVEAMADRFHRILALAGGIAASPPRSTPPSPTTPRVVGRLHRQPGRGRAACRWPPPSTP